MPVAGRPRRRLQIAALGVIAAFAALPAASAQAVHLFPLTPMMDPLGHDCAKALTTPTAPAQAGVLVAGFSFIDSSTNTSTSRVRAGDSVRWAWLMDHCHSVTFSPAIGTYGLPGFQPPQPELVRWSPSGSSFQLTFPAAGTYNYLCVHHAGVGMTGTVVVT